MPHMGRVFWLKTSCGFHTRFQFWRKYWINWGVSQRATCGFDASGRGSPRRRDLVKPFYSSCRVIYFKETLQDALHKNDRLILFNLIKRGLLYGSGQLSHMLFGTIIITSNTLQELSSKCRNLFLIFPNCFVTKHHKPIFCECARRSFGSTRERCELASLYRFYHPGYRGSSYGHGQFLPVPC